MKNLQRFNSYDECFKAFLEEKGLPADTDEENVEYAFHTWMYDECIVLGELPAEDEVERLRGIIRFDTDRMEVAFSDMCAKDQREEDCGSEGCDRTKCLVNFIRTSLMKAAGISDGTVQPALDGKLDVVQVKDCLKAIADGGTDGFYSFDELAKIFQSGIGGEPKVDQHRFVETLVLVIGALGAFGKTLKDNVPLDEGKRDTYLQCVRLLLWKRNEQKEGEPW